MNIIKNLTIIELAEQLKNGDQFRCGESDEWETFIDRAPNDLTVSLKQTKSNKWEIQKKEEKPITAEEYGEINKEAIGIEIRIERVIGFQAGDKNGELRTELKYKQIVEYLEDIIKGGTLSGIAKEMLQKELLNLIK